MSNSAEEWWNLGLEAYEDGDFDLASKYWDKALNLDPNYGRAWNSKGTIYEKLQQYEQALECYDNALNLNPNFYQAWIGKAIVIGILQGYEAQIKIYDEGLQTLQPTYPEYKQGCAFLHWRKGVKHYNQGKIQLDNFRRSPRSYWEKSKINYDQALSLLDINNPEQLILYLEILQDMIKVCYALQDEVTTKIWLTNAIELSEGLFQQMKSDEDKIRLQRKFASFGQFLIDDLINSNKYQEAFQLIEERKNLNIHWLISSLSNSPTNNPTYNQIKTLLKPKTAILCWHLSPVNLTTFVIKDQQEDWVNLSSDSLRKLEDWLKIWKEDYQKFVAKDSRKKDEKQERKPKTKAQLDAEKSWKDKMPEQLEELKKILKINDILEQIKDIDHLIISPHRDLWLLPLVALFPERIKITYQPSLKIALERTNQVINFSKEDKLLIIDNPTEDLKFSTLEGDIISKNYPNYARISGKNATKETVIKHLKKPKSKAPTQIKIEHLGNGLFKLYSPHPPAPSPTGEGEKFVNHIFHYTGHGQHNFNSPGNSGLKLRDTILTINELSQEIDDLSHYQIGNIIGCETGVSGTEELINEFVSIGSIFYAKGVKNVISSLWQVEDLATSLLMIKMYEILPTTNNISVALQTAQIWLKNSTKTDFATYIKGLSIPSNYEEGILHYIDDDEKSEKPFNSPYYWGGFYAIM